MKINTILVAAALATSSTVAKEAVWNAEGSGGWGSSSRWVNGNVPDPDGGETWTVTINDGDTAVVTDADKRYFECIASLAVGENAKLVVTNYSPLTFNFPTSGKGKVEIYGSGVVTQRYETSYYQYNNTGGWEVFGGTLAIYCTVSHYINLRCPYGVWAPGVIQLDPVQTVNFRGLYGDGTIEDPTGGSLSTVTFAALNNPNDPCNFTGSFSGVSGSFNLTINGAYQCISNAVTAASLYKPDLYNDGTLSLVAFPNQINMRHDAGVEYCGPATTVGGKISLLNQARRARLDAGPSGGATFTTTMDFPTSLMCIFNLTGDNDATAVFSGSLPFGADDCAAYLKKTGTGTWRITGSASGNNGTVAVEKGTLEYETIAERGNACSLGRASLTHSEYTGNRDDEKKVPYACIIGDGTDVADESVATLKYVGSAAATITNRAVAVSGTGCFAADNAVLDWTGFSSASDDGGTLILAGAATGSVARAVTDGTGPLSVVKDGEGTWTLADTINFSGGVTVKKGVLKMKLGQYYTWFRYVVKRVYNDNQNRAYLGHMSFFSADGVDQSLGITYNATARSNNLALKPGQVTFSDATQTFATSYPGENLFTEYTANGAYARWSYSPAKVVVETNDTTWLTLVVRLRGDSDPIVKYDMISALSDSNKPSLSTPRSWDLYGSPDGVNWTLIDSQSDFKKYRASENYWLSDQSAYSNDSPTGFAFSSTEAATSEHVKMSSVSSVSVSAGAKLVSDKAVPANAIEFDAGEGAGTIDGFSFPAEGVLELKGCGSALAENVNIPLCFTNCTDVANISGWALSMDGKPIKLDKYKFTASSSGIAVSRVSSGVMLIIN